MSEEEISDKNLDYMASIDSDGIDSSGNDESIINSSCVSSEQQVDQISVSPIIEEEKE